MSDNFDPGRADHVMALAAMLDGILNSGQSDVRFALVVWRDRESDVQGLVSNASDDKTVIGMLDDAKARINTAESFTHQTHGHA
jgi:N-acyl-D-aspartate/D-glutamate deacylase